MQPLCDSGRYNLFNVSSPGDGLADDGQGAGLCHRLHSSNQAPLLALVMIMVILIMVIFSMVSMMAMVKHMCMLAH